MNKSYFISTLLCAALFASSTHLEKVTVICEDEESIEDENYFLTHTLSPTFIIHFKQSKQQTIF
jgi:hypothetical protein